MIDREFIKNLTPVELELIASYVHKLVKDKINDKTDNHTNLDSNVKCCPYCKSKHYVKNGFNKGKRQKYLCKDCKKIFLSTTNTIFSRSRIPYCEWTNFIASEVNGLTLSQEAIQISKSITTCFYMRHKLYRAISDLIESQILSNHIEMDFTYHKINLKGTKPYNMPRLSKKRGKSDKHDSTKGISNHKICIFTAVDSNDNIINKIAGLGCETYDKLMQFNKYFSKGSLIISDSKSSNDKFAKSIKADIDRIPHKKHTTKYGNSIASVNQIHMELKELNRKKKGISTRHLPDYLNWYSFLKKLIYSYEAKVRKTQSYMDVMNSFKTLNNKDVCHIPMPIDLYKAYKDYRYGVFASLA